MYTFYLMLFIVILLTPNIIRDFKKYIKNKKKYCIVNIFLILVFASSLLWCSLYEKSCSENTSHFQMLLFIVFIILDGYCLNKKIDTYVYVFISIMLILQILQYLERNGYISNIDEYIDNFLNYHTYTKKKMIDI
jgi:hypothetical protein